MKKLILIAILIVSNIVFAQKQILDASGYKEADATTKAALVTIDNTLRWLVYDDTNNRWEYYNGSAWVELAAGGGGSMTDAQVKTAYENNADTNAFTDAEKSKLALQSGTNTGDQDLSNYATLDGAEALTNKTYNGVNLIGYSFGNEFLNNAGVYATLIAGNISFDSYLTITSPDMQAALEELKDEVDALPSGGFDTTVDRNITASSYIFDGTDFSITNGSFSLDGAKVEDIGIATNTGDAMPMQQVLDSIAAATSSAFSLKAITTGYNVIEGDEGNYILEYDNASNGTFNIDTFANQAIPVGSIITVKQKGEGEISANYLTGVTGEAVQTYNGSRVFSLLHVTTDNWEVIDAPIDYIDSYKETLYNQATEPTGVGTQLPNTATFIANVDMMLCQKIINGVLRYYWVEL